VPPQDPPHQARTDRAVARLALWLGCFGFGGGYALISQIQQQVVTRWGWMDDREFLRSVAVAQTVPGATAGNLLTLIGLRVSSWKTSLIAVLLFITPSALLMALAAVFYERLRHLGAVDALFRGLAPAVLAIIVAVGVRLARTLRRAWQPLVALAAFAAVATHLLGVLPTILVTLLGAELARRMRQQPALLAVPLPFLALVFVQISLTMFGGGYAMIAAINHELVEKLHWLPGREFSDAIALSQITPGPIATAAAFIGYRLAGAAGAVVAMASIFMPSFCLTLLAARFLGRFGEHEAVRNAIEALSATTVGLIFAAAAGLALASGFVGSAAQAWPAAVTSWGLAATGTAVLLIWRVNPLWVLAGTPVLRLLASALAGG
jgi:chromate transporter